MATTPPPRPSSTPGSAQPAGKAVSACPIGSCTLTSQTYAASPANRARTKIGVGEEVTLTYSPGVGDIKWSATGGTLSPKSGASVTFTAEDTAGKVTITATGSLGSASITFTVVIPAELTMMRKPDSPLLHGEGYLNCGFTGKPLIHPNDVNFYRVEIRELDSRAITSGVYNDSEGAFHGGESYRRNGGASSWLPLSSHNDTDGTGGVAEDTIYAGYPSRYSSKPAPPYEPGTLTFPITWQWRVIGMKEIHYFPQLLHSQVLDQNGLVTISKGGYTAQCRYDDPSMPR